MRTEVSITDTSLTVNVHLGSAPELRRFLDSRDPFVSVELGGGVAMLCSDPELLAGLAEVCGQAAVELAEVLDPGQLDQLASSCSSEAAWDAALQRTSHAGVGRAVA